jgi:hypothetical protein
MKLKLKNNKEVTSLPQLIQAVKMMWVTDMNLVYFKKLPPSMPNRLKQVIKSKGDMTKY